MKTFLRLLGFLKPHLPHVALAVLLGVATVVSNVGLLATAAYVISAAALVSFLGSLVVPVYMVRLFGISREGTRYAELIREVRRQLRLGGGLDVEEEREGVEEALIVAEEGL